MKKHKFLKCKKENYWEKNKIFLNVLLIKFYLVKSRDMYWGNRIKVSPIISGNLNQQEI